jgi:hypothetical protein
LIHPADFRPAEESDTNMILSDWLKSFRRSPLATDMTNAVYFRGHEALVKKALKRSEIICAVNKEDPNHVFGWICFEKQSIPILHYLYVKEAFRKFGIGTNLFHHMRSTTFAYTHKTDSIERFTAQGIYSLYHFLEG